ncbi:hypothetical protein EJ06DRAFT_559235 [Trichodelitschia bisporula]|uniref:Uncharacterized protein n=1 Tax=Trichodelitschia bisporula TaxID=703511 RepID=A0A6G1HMN5_9PEZI|nr:hypothetical protein EJ06DRAFT_559235 [Trichodelitschia bisporula]
MPSPGAVNIISTQTLPLEAFSKAAEDNLQILGKPQFMTDSLLIKDYQLGGLNWLNLLYEQKLGGNQGGLRLGLPSRISGTQALDDNERVYLDKLAREELRSD